MDTQQEQGGLDGRIALITGASRGIGRAMALKLAEQGAHVIAVARTQGALEALDDEIRAATGKPATLVPLDITDFEGIDRLGGAIHERWGRLDIFLGAAGVLGPMSPLGHIEPKYWEETHAINVTANWRCIRSFDPLLRVSDAGRAVFITSRAGWKCRAYWGAYATSKAALECLARVYAEEVASTNLRVHILNPGPIRTRMRAAAFPGEDPETLPTPEELAEAAWRICSPQVDANGVIFSFNDGKLEQEPTGGNRA